jgi:hypothetical protein
MSRAYPPAQFDPPERIRADWAVWHRVFRCASCGATLGRQRISLAYAPDPGGMGLGPASHRIERIELWWELGPIPPGGDGMRRFGPSRRAYLAKPSPPGVQRRPSLRRATSVLPTVEGTDQFGNTRRGDPYRVARHDPRRAKASDGEFRLALGEADAHDPIVVTCPNQRCRRHWLVAGLPPEAAFT